MDTEQTATTKRWLVKEAEDLLEKVKEKPGFGDSRQGATSQLRNLLQIAQQESEVPVLRNFIRYQTGRKATQKFWKLICDDLIRVLAEIDAKPHLQKAADRKLAIQLFFGYMVRHYVYLHAMKNPAQGDDNPEEALSDGRS